MPRLRATLTIEYDADPKDYGTTNPKEMAAIDQANFIDDPIVLLSISDDLAITVNIIGGTASD